MKSGTGTTGLRTNWTPDPGTNGGNCAPGSTYYCATGADADGVNHGAPDTGGSWSQVLIAEEDPAKAGTALVLTQQVCLIGGSIINFSLDYATYGSNKIGTTFNLAFMPVQQGATTEPSQSQLQANTLTDTVTGSAVHSPGVVVDDTNDMVGKRGLNTKGSAYYKVTSDKVPQTGLYWIALVWTFDTTTTRTSDDATIAVDYSWAANDIGITSLYAYCGGAS